MSFDFNAWRLQVIEDSAGCKEQLHKLIKDLPTELRNHWSIGKLKQLYQGLEELRCNLNRDMNEELDFAREDFEQDAEEKESEAIQDYEVEGLVDCINNLQELAKLKRGDAVEILFFDKGWKPMVFHGVSPEGDVFFYQTRMNGKKEIRTTQSYCARAPKQLPKELSKTQKYAIASSLSTSSFNHVLEQLSTGPEEFQEAAIQFATNIDKHYLKRDGFIPRKVLQIIRK